MRLNSRAKNRYESGLSEFGEDRIAFCNLSG
jgi:hypothetical protein